MKMCTLLKNIGKKIACISCKNKEEDNMTYIIRNVHSKKVYTVGVRSVVK